MEEVNKNNMEIVDMEDVKDYNSFIKKLGVIINTNYRAKFDQSLSMGLIEFVMKLDGDDIKELLTEYYLPPTDITLNMAVDCGSIQIKYLYKGSGLSPICHWLQPENCRRLDALEILRECVKQDKHNPDVKHLELMPAIKI